MGQPQPLWTNYIFLITLLIHCYHYYSFLTVFFPLSFSAVPEEMDKDVSSFKTFLKCCSVETNLYKAHRRYTIGPGITECGCST